MEIKSCPNCGKDLHLSYEPRVTNGTPYKKRIPVWRHADESECNYRES